MSNNFYSWDQHDFDDTETEMSRFELLSAYLDGEVNPRQKQQVEQWLKEDPKTQQLYQRLLKLRLGMRSIPTPSPSLSAESLAQAVFAKVEKPKRNLHRRMAIVGGAVAATVLTAISFMTPGGEFTPQIANSIKLQSDDESKLLAVAINEPTVIIPEVTTPQ